MPRHQSVHTIQGQKIFQSMPSHQLYKVNREYYILYWSNWSTCQAELSSEPVETSPPQMIETTDKVENGKAGVELFTNFREINLAKVS